MRHILAYLCQDLHVERVGVKPTSLKPDSEHIRVLQYIRETRDDGLNIFPVIFSRPRSEVPNFNLNLLRLREVIKRVNETVIFSPHHETSIAEMSQSKQHPLRPYRSEAIGLPISQYLVPN